MADPAGGRLDPKSWPGTDSDGKQTVIHKDQVKKIIKALQADRDAYDNASEGTVADLQGRGTIKDPKVMGGGPDDKTGYPAGRLLHTYLQNASTHIPTAYANFLQSYQSLIDSLGRQTGTYDSTETTNTDNVNGANTGNTTYYGSNPNT